MVTKNDAIEAWTILDDIIDELSWSSTFTNNELNNIERSITILQEFIKQQKEKN